MAHCRHALAPSAAVASNSQCASNTFAQLVSTLSNWLGWSQYSLAARFGMQSPHYSVKVYVAHICVVAAHFYNVLLVKHTTAVLRMSRLFMFELFT